MSSRALLFATAAMVAAAPAHAGEELLFGPPPEWVEIRASAPPKGEENELPARIVEMSSQVRFEDDRQSVYSALRLEFQTPQGLDGGNLTFAWRPETQDLTIHKVVIRRGDETIDVLESGQTFSILRREQNLEQAMLDGTLTASLFPEDLQVGDVLEFASTVVTRDPVLAGHNEIAIGPLNFPIDRADIRLQWPAGTSVKLSKTDDLPEWKRTRKDGFETVALTLEEVEPLPLPRLAPLRYAMIRFIEATDYAAWSDVAAQQLPLYRKAAQIPEQGPLRTEVERIRESSPDPLARTEAALRLVQGRVRYVALAMGEGGLVPADAEQTWARRYGDCKAKTALLLAILGELGIEAEAVAVHTALGDMVAQRLPTIGAFDHILVRARIDGREYWLDGTRTGDTNLAKLRVPDFGWGLPIVQAADLVRIVPAPLEEPHSDLAIHMDASKGVRVPVPTRIELILRGDAAIGTNQAFANFAGEARDRALREYWRRRFDFVEPESVSLAYDATALEARMVLEGSATLTWRGSWYETEETRLGYRADFSREAGPGRDAPYAVSHPFYTRTRQTIVLPDGFTRDAVSGRDTVEELVAGVEYRRHTRFEDNTFFVEATERSVATEFVASDAPAFQKRLRELWANGVHLRMPSGSRVTETDLAVMLEEEPRDAQGYIDQAVMLMDRGEYAGAIERLIQASALDPENPWAWANHGLSLAHVDRLAEADEALDRAVALDPDVWVAYNGRGVAAEKRQDWPAAIAAYSRVLEIEPDNGFARMRLALAYLARADTRPLEDIAGRLADFDAAIEAAPGFTIPRFVRAQTLWRETRYDEALDDTAEILDLDPRASETYLLRANIFNALNRREDALKEAEAIVRVNPDETFAYVAAGKIYDRFEMREQALAAMDRALAIKPEGYIYLNRSQVRDRGDWEGRLADLDAALSLDRDDMSAIYMKAALLSEMGDHSAAAEVLTSAADAAPDDADLLNSRGIAWARAGRPGEAEQDFAKARSIAVDAITLNNLCYPKAVANVALERALEECEESLRLRPDFPPTLDSRGAVLLRLGRLDEAIRDFDRVLEQVPTLANSRYLRAVARSLKGDAAGADADLAVVRGESPELIERMERDGFVVTGAEPAQ